MHGRQRFVTPKNIYKEIELDKKATTEDLSTVQIEGNREVKRNVKCYSLDGAIAVGCRINFDEAIRKKVLSKDNRYLRKLNKITNDD